MEKEQGEKRLKFDNALRHQELRVKKDLNKSYDQSALELEQKVLECEKKKLELATEINHLDLKMVEARIKQIDDSHDETPDIVIFTGGSNVSFDRTPEISNTLP